MTISDRSPSRTIRRTAPPCHTSPQPTHRRPNGLPTKTIAWILAVAMTASPAIFCSSPASAQQQPILSSATQVVALDHDGSGGYQWHFNANTGASYNTTVTAAKLRTLIRCAYIYASENDDQFPPVASMLFDET